MVTVAEPDPLQCCLLIHSGEPTPPVPQKAHLQWSLITTSAACYVHSPGALSPPGQRVGVRGGGRPLPGQRARHGGPTPSEQRLQQQHRAVCPWDTRSPAPATGTPSQMALANSRHLAFQSRLRRLCLRDLAVPPVAWYTLLEGPASLGTRGGACRSPRPAPLCLGTSAEGERPCLCAWDGLCPCKALLAWEASSSGKSRL